MYQSMSYLKSICKSYLGLKVLLVDEIKPSRDPDVKVVDVHKNQFVLNCART